MEKHKIFHLLSLVGFLDLFAVSMIIPLVPGQILRLGADSVVAGFIGSLYGALQLFSSPTVGTWSDFKGRKFVLLFCLITSGFSYLLLGYTTVIYGLIIARILIGCLKHSQSLIMAYSSNMLSKDERSAFYGYYNGISNIGFILGPTLGGHIAEFSNGFFYVSCLVALIFIINASIIWYWLPEVKCTKIRTKSSQQVTSKLNHITQFFINFKSCWDIMAFRLILGFSTLVYRSNFSLVLNQNFGLTPKYIGYLTSFQGVVSTFSGLATGFFLSLDSNPNRQTLYGALVLTLALFGLAITDGLIILVCSLGLLSISTSYLRVCLSSILASRSQNDKFGSIFGIGQSVTSLARMLAPIAGGAALQMGSYGPGLVGFLTSGCGVFLALILCIFPNTKPIKQD